MIGTEMTDPAAATAAEVERRSTVQDPPGMAMIGGSSAACDDEDKEEPKVGPPWQMTRVSFIGLTERVVTQTIQCMPPKEQRTGE